MTDLQRDQKVFEMAETMTLRQIDDEQRKLAGRRLTRKQVETFHLLSSAKARIVINQTKIGQGESPTSRRKETRS